MSSYFINHVLSLFSIHDIKLTSQRMIGHGRHLNASRRRESSAMARGASTDADGMPTKPSPRRRRAVAVADHKSCALIQTRLKLGELV